jgi:hypothetical protein
MVLGNSADPESKLSLKTTTQMSPLSTCSILGCRKLRASATTHTNTHIHQHRGTDVSTSPAARRVPQPVQATTLVHQFPELVKCTRHPPHAYKQPVWTRYSTGATQCSLLGLLCLQMHQMQKRDGRGRTCGGTGHVSLIRRVPVSASERWCKQTKMYMKLCGKHEVVVTLVQSNLLQK